MDVAAVEVRVVRALHQEVTVAARGPDVLRMQGEATAAEDEDAVMDPVVAFVRAVELGMMDGDAPAEERPRAVLASVETDGAERRRTWRLEAAHLTAGVLVVLRNMLSSLDLEEAAVVTSSAPEAPGAPPVDMSDAALPAAPRGLPFAVNVEPPERTSRGRHAQIVFASPLGRALAREVAGAFDAWTAVLNLGGYPARGRAPAASGALPEPAFQLDTNTVEQAFPDLFLCDERCFGAVLGLARRLHERGDTVEAVVLG
ncbi:hypothetical protein WME91_52520 [Sorangium sp. So ce269]